MYSFSYLEPACLSMSSSNCCFLTCIQVSQRGRSGGLVFLSLSGFSTVYVIHTVKGFGIVNNAEIDVFLEFSCFLNDLVDVGSLISDSSAFSKTSLSIWNFMVHGSSHTPIIQILVHLILCWRSLRLSVLFILFSLFCSS